MMTTPKPTKRKPNDSNKPNDDAKSKESAPPPPKYGPLPRISQQRLWSRATLIFGVLIFVWYTSKDGKETSLAKQKEILPKRGQNVDCDPDYLSEIKKYPGCVPKKCGRFVSDKIVTVNELEALLNVAKRGISLGGSSGGASILDLHSGALSYKDKFININTLKEGKKFVSASDLAIYRIVKDKIKSAIAEAFGIDQDDLFLTHPTFFSKLTKAEPITAHDEYWHIHIDKVTYESFHYTSLLYLTDYKKDFKGGRFVFVDSVEKPLRNTTVEPRKGRVLMFTSGAENPHFVERVTDGERYAITISFTCDDSKAINDPVMH